MEKVIIAYATRHGYTGEAAEYIGKIVRDKGFEVDVEPATDVESLDGYKAVILGTSIKGDAIMPEATAFAERFRGELDSLPAAFFGLSMVLADQTEENKKHVLATLNQLRFGMRPLGVGVFGGVRDANTLPYVLRWTARFSKIPVGDFRDWDEIKAWAERIATLIKENRAY